MEGLVSLIFLVGIFYFGWLCRSEIPYEFNHRIEPTQIMVNQQTGDTTFVYIME